MDIDQLYNKSNQTTNFKAELGTLRVETHRCILDYVISSSVVSRVRSGWLLAITVEDLLPLDGD